MTVDAATILSQLNDRVNEQLKVQCVENHETPINAPPARVPSTNIQSQAVTCKWLARHHHIPINVAKQLLFAFVEQQGAQVCPTYFISGIAKDTGALTTQLATSATLEAQRALYARLDSLHVYGVQPKVAVQDVSALWNSDLDQAESLHRAFLSAERSDDESGLQDKAIGAIRYVRNGGECIWMSGWAVRVKIPTTTCGKMTTDALLYDTPCCHRCDACSWTAHPGPRLPLKQIGGTDRTTTAPDKGAATATTAPSKPSAPSKPTVPSKPAPASKSAPAAPATKAAKVLCCLGGALDNRGCMWKCIWVCF